MGKERDGSFKKAVLSGPGPSPTDHVEGISPPLWFSPGKAQERIKVSHPPSDIELMLQEYQRAREEAKVEIARPGTD